MSFQYFRDVLPSGLRVITVETPHLHTALVAAYVRVGSRHEDRGTNGVSHFLEHMFFRGSQTYPDTLRMNAAVEDAGGNLNGVTTRDHSYYYTPLHPEHLDVGVRILGDMLTRPLLPQIDIERQIILEEMLDEVDEQGRDIDVDNLSKMELFGGHPLALKIAGTADSVKGLTLPQLRTHLARHYVAGNLVVTAAGDVHRDRVLELVTDAFNALPQGPSTRDLPPPRPEDGPRFRFVHHEDAQTEFRLTFRTVPEQHPDHLPLQLLRRVLDDGLSSRLPFNIVERRGLAYSIHAGMESFDDVGLFEVEGASAPAKASLVVEEICRILAELSERDATEEELARAKRRNRMFLDFAQDSPGELAGWFGGTEVFRTPESFDERARLVEAQTARDVRRVARRYFTRKNLLVVAVGPRKGVKALEQVVRAAELPAR
jgi:predicted Zn-dependent peptidase